MTNEILITIEGDTTRHRVEDRHDLDAVQDLLLRCRGSRGSVRCACCGRDDIWLVLDVFVRKQQGESVPESGAVEERRAYLRRARRHDCHHPACIWRLPDGPSHPTEINDVRPSPAMFGPPETEITGDVWSDDDADFERVRRQTITFHRLASRAIANGIVAAWRQSIALHGSRVTAPDAGLLARGVDCGLRHQLCTDNTNVEEAAARCGVRLAHGIILDEHSFRTELRPRHIDTPLLAYEVLRSFEAVRLQATKFLVPPSVLELALSSVRTFRSHVTPPYYYFAVVQPDNRVRRLVICPVFFDMQHLIWVDSGLERACVADLLKRAECFLKPPERSVVDDVAALHPDLKWLSTIPSGQLPDFILVGSRRTVAELAGFDRRFLPYRTRIDQKHGESMSSSDYTFEVWEGAQFRGSFNPPLQWVDAKLPMFH